MERVVEPELLDQLPPSDPRAIHSRRDLRRINFWMGNVGLIQKRLLELKPSPKRILEIGAGDGRLMEKLAIRFGPQWGKNVSVVFLDIHPTISNETRNAIEAQGWKIQIVQANLRDWVRQSQPESFDLIIANLFLHHFSFEELAIFFQAFAKTTESFLSCDPRRWEPAVLFAKLLWLIGCNFVTRHDANVSIRAGFRDEELSAIWPEESGFNLQENDASYASHLFFARRIG